MNCQDFECVLDAVFAGGETGRESQERLAFERHAADCTACSDLLALALLPLSASPGLATEVLDRTSGGACRQAEGSLNDLVTGELSNPADRHLVSEHLRDCRGCSQIVEELARLTADLPRLAVLQPEERLVEAVLRRTLPFPVRLRRWWAATWPAWVRRPRFAAELAYAATLLLVVALVVSGSPLQAMPERAVRLVAGEQLGRLPASAESELASRVRAAAGNARRLSVETAAAAQATLGTISREVASWFVTADDESSAQDQPKQETS